MINIEYKDKLKEEEYEIIDEEFNKFAAKNEIVCNYKDFSFIAKEENKILGIITGNSYYKEIHICDLIVLEEYRNKHIGSQLIKAVEDFYKDKGFENINLTTYAFQAPEFYKKCGYKIEFIRKNEKNSKLDKYYMIKYFKSSSTTPKEEMQLSYSENILEKCLPGYLENDLKNLKEGLKNDVSYIDCLIDELQGSINSAWTDGDITEEQCDYLYKKYIRMEK